MFGGATVDKAHPIYNFLLSNLTLIIFIAASIALSIAGLAALFKFLNFLQKKRESYVLRVVLKHLKRPLYFLIPILSIYLFTPILTLSGPWTVILQGIQALMIAFITWVLLECVWVLEKTFVYRMSRGIENAKTRTIKTQVRFISRLCAILVFVIMAAIFLMTFESAKRVGIGLLTSAGIVSVILGFAAQKTLGGVLTGFQIAFNRTLRIDDAVVIEGECGHVEEMSLTHVIVRLTDRRRLIIPINYFMEKSFQNLTLTSSELLSSANFYLDYSVDVNLLRTELDRLLEGHPLWDQKVKMLQVTDMTEKCMIVRILLSGRNTTEVFDLCAFVREKLIHYLNEHFPECLPKLRSETHAITK